MAREADGSEDKVLEVLRDIYGRTCKLTARQGIFYAESGGCEVWGETPDLLVQRIRSTWGMP
jgi:hypothetical protein